MIVARLIAVLASLLGSASARSDSILNLLREALKAHPGAGDKSETFALAQRLLEEGRIAELVGELETGEILRTDLALRYRALEVLIRALDERGFLADPAQIDFLIHHFCEEDIAWEFHRFSATVSPEQVPRVLSALASCLAGDVDIVRATDLLGCMGRMGAHGGRADPEVVASLRALIVKDPGRFDSLWRQAEHLAQLPPEPPDDLLGPGDPGYDPVRMSRARRILELLEHYDGALHRSIRWAAARALFATTPDLRAEVAWAEDMEGESLWAALAGMMAALQFDLRYHVVGPFAEADAETQVMYFTLIGRAAGLHALRKQWECCWHPIVGNVPFDERLSHTVRIAAARSVASIHEQSPKTAPEAERFKSLARDLEASLNPP